jgi:hypothetical protein
MKTAQQRIENAENIAKSMAERIFREFGLKTDGAQDKMLVSLLKTEMQLMEQAYLFELAVLRQKIHQQDEPDESEAWLDRRDRASDMNEELQCSPRDCGGKCHGR